MNKWLYLLMAVILLAAFNVCEAASVSIAWDPPIASNGVTGYKIYHGPMSRGYTASGDAGNVCSGRVSDLDPAKTYYFAITAYNSSSNESEYSAELVWDNTLPTITGPSSRLLKINEGRKVALPDYRNLFTASDNFSGSTDIKLTQVPEQGTMIDKSLTVKIRATDEAGNTSDFFACVVELDVVLKPGSPGGVRGIAEDGSELQMNEGAE